MNTNLVNTILHIEMRSKKRLYLTEAAHTITIIRDCLPSLLGY